MRKWSDADTKTLILDAAEVAFADLGFDAASLRHIIALAGVNLAAVHYHFGSKEALLAAVFQRRIAPMSAERFARLDRIEQASGNGPLPLEGILEALIEPALQLARAPDKGGSAVVRLFGRTIAEPNEMLQKLLSQEFGETLRRFSSAFARALPDLPQPVLMWRIQFVIGAMGHVMCDPSNLKESSAGLCDPTDIERAVDEMVAFLAAGLRAPWNSGQIPHPTANPGGGIA
jgi:AcrR family transcriptional regulator